MVKAGTELVERGWSWLTVHQPPVCARSLAGSRCVIGYTTVYRRCSLADTSRRCPGTRANGNWLVNLLEKLSDRVE